jgi:hypothetical protein
MNSFKKRKREEDAPPKAATTAHRTVVPLAKKPKKTDDIEPTKSTGPTNHKMTKSKAAAGAKQKPLSANWKKLQVRASCIIDMRNRLGILWNDHYYASTRGQY